MGISASVGTQIPTNVVEVGTEITQPSLDAISSAPSATSVNRFVVLNDLTAKANLSGASFTGKIVTTATVSTAPLNIASTTTPPTTTVAGDVWVGSANIFFKDSLNTQRACLINNGSNAIDTSAIVAALRVTQRGTGNAIEVEDSTTPDATKFVVDQFGKVGIGVVPDATACLSVDATGIKFNDGTQQTTASAGIIGPTGPTGPAGADATAWVYKGTYDNGYTYSVGDFVTLDGSSYVMYTYIGAGGYPPTSYTGSWQLVANKGDIGPQGNDGPQGSSGNDGGTYPDASADGQAYVRQNNNWVTLISQEQSSISDAPNDGNLYARQNGGWVQIP